MIETRGREQGAKTPFYYWYKYQVGKLLTPQAFCLLLHTRKLGALFYYKTKNTKALRFFPASKLTQDKAKNCLDTFEAWPKAKQTFFKTWSKKL